MTALEVISNEAALTPDEARELTDRIKLGVETVWHLIVVAYQQRAWSALGYPSWDDYCTREFGSARIRLPREERPDVVASLRESGLSTRAIAAATGLHQETVVNDLKDVNGNRSPAEVTGTDGKTYPVRSCEVDTEQLQQWRDEGLSYAEIGRRAGIHETTARLRLTRSTPPTGGPDKSRTAVDVSPKPGVIPQHELCALCGTTRKQRGSLCWTCDEEMERASSYEFPVPNFETCPVDGSALNRLGWCDECAARNWKPVTW